MSTVFSIPICSDTADTLSLQSALHFISTGTDVQHPWFIALELYPHSSLYIQDFTKILAVLIAPLVQGFVWRKCAFIVGPRLSLWSFLVQSLTFYNWAIPIVLSMTAWGVMWAEVLCVCVLAVYVAGSTSALRPQHSDSHSSSFALRSVLLPALTIC